MSVLEQAYATARARKARVVLPEMDDARVQEAAETLAREGLAEPVMLSSAQSPENYVDVVLKAKPKLSLEDAMGLLTSEPMMRAAAMVAKGEVDAMVAGAATATSRVIRSAIYTVGMAPGVSRASSFFLLRFPDNRYFVFADCAVNLAPDAETLAAIARASAASATALMGEARVALLSYSTMDSGAGPSVDVVREAMAIMKDDGMNINGPCQADAALNPIIASRKGIHGGGHSNVLVFPSLDAGNIAYKLCQELAGAQAIGPFLQGFARPICDLSRGATAQDIVDSTAVTIAMAARRWLA